MKLLFFIVSFWIGAFHLCGQKSVLYNKMKELYDVSPSEITSKYGLLDGTLPIALMYHGKKDDFRGLISYGNNSHIVQQMDGLIDHQEMAIYEYEDNAVSNTLIGSTNSSLDNALWKWKSQNQQLELPILLKVNPDRKKVVLIFGSNDGKSLSQIVLRPNKRQISIERNNQINLRWMDYSCEGSDCIEGRQDEHLENPVEFAINEESILIYPDENVTLDHEIEYQNISIDSNSYFISYDFPILKQKTFDKWLKAVIQKELKKEIKRLDQVVEEDESTYRFKYRSYGDFYISLVSDEIISGYMLLRSSNESRLRTIPFNYDRDKKRFYNLKDVFKRDFDYPYFLKTYINKQKRNLLYKEQGVAKQLISEEPFSHMVFSPSGLIFFTDFNTIFGRRHIVIPFEEIKSFIGSRSISKYIQKERFK
ncbi:MAG: hypothetical protein ACI9FN_001265 [Saprospiraceae bacterium]|jgi:hypothetical protein